MGRRIEIEINGVTWRGTTPSAKDQLEMLQVSSQSGILPALTGELSDMGLTAAVATLNGGHFSRLKELCLKNGNFVRDADSVPVAENLFQDEIHNYLLLLGKALQENIGPFWQLSAGSENGAEETKERTEAE